MTEHLWQGERIADDEARRRLDELEATAGRVLAGEQIRPLRVIRACDRVAARLADQDDELTGRLTAALAEQGVPAAEARDTLDGLAAALRREPLERKLIRELGGTDPGRLARFDHHQTVFEAWAPVGLLAHVAPGNAPAAGALSVVEGLLSGNLNVIKTSGADAGFTTTLLAALADADPGGGIAERVIVLAFPSARTEWLRLICAAADAVAVWGGEEAVAGMAGLVRPGCRLVDWGPKLSFAYLTTESCTDDVLAEVAADVCRLDQQACSSPQVIYLDTDDEAELFAVGTRFARVLERVSAESPARVPGDAEWAEITNTVLVADLERHLGLTDVHTAEDRSWRVLVDTRSALRASPLHRTVWVKPLPRKEIGRYLRPMRRYLQTAGVGADRTDVAVLSRMLLAAGVQRVTVPGAMLGSYDGEPHDGVYALQRYSRRVDVQLDDRFATDSCLDDLTGTGQLPAPDVPITGKAAFGTLQEDTSRAAVFFRSGGTTGEPKLSAFSWADYDEHMHAGAEGLLAAGLDPRTDRVMNLFFGGQLYGGFLSFFSVLERLGAVQFPMAGQQNGHAMVVKSIVDNRVDTLLGMPSYLMRLFVEEGAALREYGGVRKIFYGGEHFSAAQRRLLTEEFGVEVIRSAAYGSVDAGPLGYQCAAGEPGEHHLFTGVQTLEILDQQQDRPAEPGQVGRLVFTSHTRRGQRLERYEIGDLGRWLDADCPCGRRTPRFELLGRSGDVFRSGGHFLNYRRFVAVADEVLGYSGDLQIELDFDGGQEWLTVRVEHGKTPEPDEVERLLLRNYPELATTAEQDRLVRLRVRPTPAEAFDRAATSGKLVPVLDRR
ncbi:phenylacetate-coenzyme A ligase PaaK-like adenylate-forming protein [Herbihabitans rhizosphaerae]|uniref:long-chain-fatty-acyl-CoA reductase n=1 Tax=Herbihabitans rhizosphaerae TaxID=1872711 RepID=A0A4Q7L379_9PSEU|nr:acyl-CoA reductase [Herbihabitans rhizosphaerae]RZS43596.1 phenylacetate-coenzyme A ligase PaaK-like adenylate-forming protein [Herbihabitans rhizosphaerae]